MTTLAPWQQKTPSYQPQRKNKRTESALVNAVMRWMWLNGCYCWRQNTGAYKPEGSSRYIQYGTPGCADIIGVTSSGVFIAVECKSAKGKLTDHQLKFRDYILEKNGIYICAKSLDDLENRKSEIVQ